MYYVYILRSQKDSTKSYIGFTENLNKRLNQHKKGSGTYSKQFAPWKLETYVAFNDKSLSESFEYYLKSGSGHAFLKKHLISKP